LRVAAAVLLVDVIGADGVASGVERERLQELLMERFSLDEASALRLMDIAERRDRETLDGREFADALARALDESARREIVAMTWEIARADGRVSEVEESAIWRIARLLGVLDPKGFAEEAMRDWQGPETAATNAPPSKPSGETSR
jgi:uncharacterized tellurite resistance protein B-like protein